MTGSASVMSRPNKAAICSLYPYQTAQVSPANNNTEMKKILGLGKNDLNIVE